jgi:methionyl-tRNA synthetase
MPATAKKMQQYLGLDPAHSFYHFNQLRKWKTIPSGTQLLKSIVLFPRIEMSEKATATVAPKQENAKSLEIKPEINMGDFSRIDLRVATILKAEPIPKARKLLKLEVDMGQKRTLVAGIAEKYTAEELIGKQVIVVANLKPAKLMGVLSDGMVVAAVDDTGPTLATLEKPVAPGTPLK